MPRRIGLVATVALALGGACAPDATGRAALLEPASCEGCHPDQVREWAGSMHAHASDDPVFLAMNRLGQRETGGALGDFCVRCHAPQAAGDPVEELPRPRRGVGCVACHQIEAVETVHNGGLAWSDGDVLLGGIADPVDTFAHGSAYSALLDSRSLESSAACGACHDVITPGGLAVERTYAEWSETIFARPEIALSCGGCHMPGRDAPAALGERPRRVHDHRMAAVDVALVPWPGGDEQRVAIARDLATTLAAKLCAQPAGGGVRIDVTLDNVGAGHAFPSGVTHARRAWVEVIGEEAGVVTYQKGSFGPGDVVKSGGDPEVWVLGSDFRDEAGEEVEHVWEAAAMTGELLGAAVTLDPADPRYYHAVTRPYFVPGAPDRVAIRVRLQPIGLDVLDALIEAGELEAEIRERMPIFDLGGTALEWRQADGWGCVP